MIIPILRAFDAELATLCPPAELPVTDSPIYLRETLPDATPRSKQGPFRALQLGAPPAAFDRLIPHLLKQIRLEVRDRAAHLPRCSELPRVERDPSERQLDVAVLHVIITSQDDLGESRALKGDCNPPILECGR